MFSASMMCFVSTGSSADPDGVCCEIIHFGQTLLLRGEIDFSNCNVLARAGSDLTGRCIAARDRAAETTPGSTAWATTAVIDVAGLAFIDAAGLGVLVALRHRLTQAGVGLRTIHPCAQVRRVSAICHLDDTLGLQPTDSDPRDEPDPLGRHERDAGGVGSAPSGRFRVEPKRPIGRRPAHGADVTA